MSTHKSPKLTLNASSFVNSPGPTIKESDQGMGRKIDGGCSLKAGKNTSNVRGKGWTAMGSAEFLQAKFHELDVNKDSFFSVQLFFCACQTWDLETIDRTYLKTIKNWIVAGFLTSFFLYLCMKSYQISLILNPNVIN